MSGIYVIKNSIDHKVYIGSAEKFSTRYRKHNCTLKSKTHSNIKLQNFVNKYGIETLSFEIVEILKIKHCKQELIRKEQWYFDIYEPFDEKGFNIAKIAGSTAGIKMTEESNQKRRIKMTGKTLPHRGRKYSLERRESYSNNMAQKRNEKIQRVASFSLDGHFIKEYDSLFLASVEMNCKSTYIKRACNSKGKFNNLLWSFLNDGESGQEIRREKYIQKGRPPKRIAQKDLSGKLIKEFESTKDIAKLLGVSIRTISKARLLKTPYKGFIFEHI